MNENKPKNIGASVQKVGCGNSKTPNNETFDSSVIERIEPQSAVTVQPGYVITEEEKGVVTMANVSEGLAFKGRNITFGPPQKLAPHPLAKIFPIEEETYAAVLENMRINGYDLTRPMTVVKDNSGQNLVLDGLTRLKAAIELGLDRVPVVFMHFETEDEMREYVVKAQICRRNCSDPVVLQAASYLIPIEAKLARERQGRKSTSARNQLEDGLSCSKAVGLILHLSKSKIDQIKSVLNDKKACEKVFHGELSINKAYTEMSTKRKEKLGASAAVRSKPSKTVPAPVDGTSKAGLASDATDKPSSGKVAGSPEPEVKDIQVPVEIIEFLVGHLPEEFIMEFRPMVAECEQMAAKTIYEIIDGRKAA